MCNAEVGLPHLLVTRELVCILEFSPETAPRSIQLLAYLFI